MKDSDRRPIVRLALTRAELALSIGMSTSSIDKMVEEGVLPPPRRWHTRKIWVVSEVEAALLDLPIDDDASVNPRDGGQAVGPGRKHSVDPREIAKAKHYLSLSEEEQRIMHRQEREDWNAAVLASPLSRPEQTGLRVFANLGVDTKIRFADLKGVHHDAVDKLKVRHYVDWASDNILPEGREYLWLTQSGLEAWTSVSAPRKSGRSAKT